MKINVVAATAAVLAVAVSRAARIHRRHPLDPSASRPSSALIAKPMVTRPTSAGVDTVEVTAVADGLAAMIPTSRQEAPSALLAPWRFNLLDETFFLFVFLD